MANYFTMEELLYSATALKKGIRNRTTQEIENNLMALRNVILNPAREWLGRPIYVTSGFRHPSVNKAIAGVGVSKTSQHMKGEAADITTGDKAANIRLFVFIRDFLPFDQLICENNLAWIHVSHVSDGSRVNRRQVLEIVDGKTVWNGTTIAHRELHPDWTLLYGKEGE